MDREQMSFNVNDILVCRDLLVMARGVVCVHIYDKVAG